MAIHSWFSCPNLSPREALFCEKPAHHSGKCVSRGCGGVMIEEWDSKDTVQFFDSPFPITISDNDISKYGIDMHKDVSEFKDSPCDRMLDELLKSPYSVTVIFF